MNSTAAAACHAASAWAQQSWDAFASCCLPSHRGSFPFSADSTTDGTPMNSSSDRSAPCLQEFGVLDHCGTQAAEPPRKATGLPRQHQSAASQLPPTARPIVLIHSPRELLAYRDARPPVYVHHHSYGDRHRHSYRDDLLPRSNSRSCDNCSEFLFDDSVCAGCSSPSSKPASPYGSVGSQKRARITDFSTGTFGSSCQGDAAVDTRNVTAGKEVYLKSSSFDSAHTTSDKDCSTKQATAGDVCSHNSPDVPPKCDVSCVPKKHKVGLPSTRLSTRHWGSDSQCRYLRRRRISLVPTLGGLHEGHLHLMRQAACLSDEVWVTVFLNPLQFQSSKDFLTYPASIDEDIRLIQQTGVVSVLFVPQREALFPLDAHWSVGLPHAATSPSAARGVRAAESTACSEQTERVCDRARHVTPQRNGKLVSASATAAAAASHATSTGSTTPAVEDSVNKKGDCNCIGQQEQPNCSGSDRFFRMRVFFKDIEDVQGEGKRRPGFFQGIGTVVAQLLTLTRPAYLHVGLKDFLQVVCLKRLICGLGLNALVVAHSTLREPSDGLSLASRNKRLSGAERTAAGKYYSVLQEVCRSYERGERRVPQLESVARSQAAAAGLHLYYITFNRWQDGAPVACGQDDEAKKTSGCCSTTSNAIHTAALASSSPLDAKQQEHMQRQENPVPQLLALGKEGAAVQAGTLQSKSGAGEEKRLDSREQQQDDNESLQGCRLQSPGKYCFTVAVRGNADTTLVDNATLTDQPQFGDLLPPPLNVPWDRDSDEAKHCFFGSFLVLGSLGMHLRYLNKDDVEMVLQAEEEDLAPRQDGPQLLLPPPYAALDATAARQRPTKVEESTGSSGQQQQEEEQQHGTADGETTAGESILQQQRTAVYGGMRERTDERMHILRRLQQLQSALFELEVAGTRKTLWIKKQRDAAATEASEQSCLRPCAHPSSAEHPVTTVKNTRTLQNGSKACRMRAMGLFKYDMKDECSCSCCGGTARLASYRTHNSVHTKESAQRKRAGNNRKNGNMCERTAENGHFRRRERLIGYVWAEEDVGGGELRGGEQGGATQKEGREGCNNGGNVCPRLRVERVFLKRERRRQTLGTHLLRAFMAATYKQLLQERQHAVSVTARHQGRQNTAVLQAQEQEQQGALSKSAQLTDTVDQRLPRMCEDREAALPKIRRAIEEQEAQGEATVEAKETRKSRGLPTCVEVQRVNNVEGAAEGGKTGSSSHDTEGGIAHVVQLENVPRYLVDVLREGGFHPATAAAETARLQAYNSSCYSMHVSLAQWYKTFVLNANV